MDSTNRPNEVPLLLTLSTRFLSLSAGEHEAAEEEEAPVSSSSDAGVSNQSTQRERRVYRGAVYEKGEDHQWHLLHE